MTLRLSTKWDPLQFKRPFYGEYFKKESIQIPYDILEYLAERYHLKTEDVMKPFVKGVMIGLDEMNSKESGPEDSHTIKS